jgi:hypothetical protein
LKPKKLASVPSWGVTTISKKAATGTYTVTSSLLRPSLLLVPFEVERLSSITRVLDGGFVMENTIY